MSRLSRSTLFSFAGLLVGIAGLVVQWIANPVKFGGFPPGILFIAGAGLLMLVTVRWWWHSIFGVLIAFWIVGLGALANQVQPNLASGNAGTVVGTVVMSAGLILAFVAGVLSIITGFRAWRTA